MHLDLQYVRSQFPALDSEWIFFDNAGGSQILAPVVRRIGEYLLDSNVQHGASYEISQLAMERVESATGAMARFLNAPDASEIIFGPSTSMLLRNLAHCFGTTLRAGDEIIVTDVDHEANIGCWMELSQRGIGIRTWEVDRERLQLDLSNLDRLLNSRTRLVAVTHSSNVLGSIHPIREIARRVHEAGALICVDGVAYAPHRPIDVKALDVDFYAVSLYKVYGPHISMLYGRRSVLERLPGLNHFFIGENEIPYKFQPGNVNYELAYGMLGLQDYLNELGSKHELSASGDKPEPVPDPVFDLIAQHEEKLAAPLLEFLRRKRGVRIIGSNEADGAVRVPTISFVLDGASSDSIVSQIDHHRIGIRFGDFYARRLIEALGLSQRKGVVRVSMVHYNTVEEVDRLIAALDPIL